MASQPTAKRLNMQIDAKAFADASAALGTTSRRGIGKVRQFDTNNRWSQEIAVKKRIVYSTAFGTANPADVMINGSHRSGMEKYIPMIGGSFADGRPDIVVTMALDENAPMGAFAADRPEEADPACEPIAKFV